MYVPQLPTLCLLVVVPETKGKSLEDIQALMGRSTLQLHCKAAVVLPLELVFTHATVPDLPCFRSRSYQTS
jgi:hypothetical protein